MLKTPGGQTQVLLVTGREGVGTPDRASGLTATALGGNRKTTVIHTEHGLHQKCKNNMQNSAIYCIS